MVDERVGQVNATADAPRRSSDSRNGVGSVRDLVVDGPSVGSASEHVVGDDATEVFPPWVGAADETHLLADETSDVGAESESKELFGQNLAGVPVKRR